MSAALVPTSSDPHGDLTDAYLAAFLNHIGGRSAHTLKAYRYDLNLWIEWCRARGLHPLDVNRGATLAWLAWLASDRGAGRRPDAVTTMSRRLSSVSSWYKYLMAIDKATTNPADLATHQRPRVDKRRSNTLALSAAQSGQLLAAADSDSPRTAALVALLLFTGARVGELLAANVEDITQQSGQPVLPVTGKGRRERLLPLPAPIYDRVSRYLASRDDSNLLPAVAAGARPSRPLFVTRTGRRLDRMQVRRDLKRLARTAGGDLTPILDRLTPHAARHSYATDLLNDGVPLRDVQYAMGHADASTTERYDHGELNLDRHPTYRRAAQVSPTQFVAPPSDAAA